MVIPILACRALQDPLTTKGGGHLWWDFTVFQHIYGFELFTKNIIRFRHIHYALIRVSKINSTSTMKQKTKL